MLFAQHDANDGAGNFPSVEEINLTLLALINVVLPGSGLLLRDRMILGCGLLIAAICVTAFVLSCSLLMSPEFAAISRLYAAGLYAALMFLSGLLWWIFEAATPIEDAILREKHALITKAWLSGQEDQARSEARQLVRRARHLPAAWALYALVIGGEQGQRAQERADNLRRRGL